MAKKKAPKTEGPKIVKRELILLHCWCEDNGQLTFQFGLMDGKNGTEEITFMAEESDLESIEDAVSLSWEKLRQEEAAEEKRDREEEAEDD